MLNIKQGAKQARNVKLTANLDQGEEIQEMKNNI